MSRCFNNCLILLLFSLNLFCCFSQPKDLIEVTNFGENPGNLDMYVYVPESISKDSLSKVPLIVAIHGCSQSLNNLIKSSGWNEMADKNQFIVLYPRQKFLNNTSHCFNWFREDDFGEKGGESESINNMVEHVKRNYKISQESVFVYGLSAGAAIGVSLLINFPDKYEAGAIFAGAPYAIATNPFKAFSVMNNVPELSKEEWGDKIESYKEETDYPSIIVVHGEEDKVVDIESSEELIKQWQYLKRKYDLKTIRQKTFKEHVERTAFVDSDSVEHIIFYRLKTIGHKLAIDEGPENNQGGQPTKYSKDINFYSTYYVAKDFGLIND